MASNGVSCELRPAGLSLTYLRQDSVPNLPSCLFVRRLRTVLFHQNQLSLSTCGHFWSVLTCRMCVSLIQSVLTHWGRVTHICVSKLTIIGSDNGLSPGRRQAIIWTNAGILLIGPLGTNFSENLTFLFTKIRLKVSIAKWQPFYLGLNVLTCVLTLVLSLGQVGGCPKFGFIDL